MSRCTSILSSAALLLVLAFGTAAAADATGRFCFWCLFECPKDDSIGEACLKSVIPPWPICKFRDIPDFIEHAKDSATRCCGDDLSECRCPKKDTDKFQADIGSWCKGVASCPNSEIIEDNFEAAAIDNSEAEIE